MLNILKTHISPSTQLESDNLEDKEDVISTTASDHDIELLYTHEISFTDLDSRHHLFIQQLI